MTSRIGSPDTQADIDVRLCLDRNPPQSFVMVAGAGSGKTTSLVKSLEYLAATRGPALRRAGQQIACVTYTEVAVAEISGDVGGSSLFHVSTIHSFLWSIIRTFQSDISAWVAARIGEKIADRKEHYDKPRTQAKTKVKLEVEIAELEAELATISGSRLFTYGTGSNYAEGILGHDDILKLTPACVAAHPLLRQLIASRFPYIFVDESQDTNPSVVEALRSIAVEQPKLCIGFFGDPMQKIYTTGAGPVALEPGWREITKPENFRCPTSVLTVINAIRAAGDGLQQTRGRMIDVGGHPQSVAGTANLFILPADDQRTLRLDAVRQWLRTATNDPLWTSDEVDADVRLLVLVHRMAATRLGFPNLYAALHDKAPANLKDGLDDGSAWPVRPVIQHILPIIDAVRRGDQFSLMSILRAECPSLEPEQLRQQEVPAVLQRLQQAIDKLVGMFGDGAAASIRDVLTLVSQEGLLRLDDRFGPYLVPAPIDAGIYGFANVMAYLDCAAVELLGYRRYIEDESPFATQQGVKGAQFDRVLVVLDDEEGSHTHFFYGKYFDFIPLSEKDAENIAEQKESVLDRTRRLFYVCCSRAVKDLAVVLFVPDVDAARIAVDASGIFPAPSVRTLADLQ